MAHTRVSIVCGNDTLHARTRHAISPNELQFVTSGRCTTLSFISSCPYCEWLLFSAKWASSQL